MRDGTMREHVSSVGSGLVLSGGGQISIEAAIGTRDQSGAPEDELQTTTAVNQPGGQDHQLLHHRAGVDAWRCAVEAHPLQAAQH